MIRHVWQFLFLLQARKDGQSSKSTGAFPCCPTCSAGPVYYTEIYKQESPDKL